MHSLSQLVVASSLSVCSILSLIEITHSSRVSSGCWFRVWSFWRIIRVSKYQVNMSFWIRDMSLLTEDDNVGLIFRLLSQGRLGPNDGGGGGAGGGFLLLFLKKYRRLRGIDPNDGCGGGDGGGFLLLFLKECR